MQILLLSKEFKFTRFLKKGLEEQLHKVTLEQDTAAMEKLVLENDFDLLLLDAQSFSLVDIDLCKQLNSLKNNIQTYVLNASSDLLYNSQTIEITSVYFFAQYFTFKDLLNKIQILENQKYGLPASTTAAIADLQINFYTKTVTRAGKLITLTVKEFSLLKILILNKNKIMSRSHIAAEVWGTDFQVGTGLINVYISYLRSKIDVGYSKQLIHTIIGKGYMLRE